MTTLQGVSSNIEAFCIDDTPFYENQPCFSYNMKKELFYSKIQFL